MTLRAVQDQRLLMTFDADTPDGLLIAAALDGDRQAFAHLVGRYQRALFRAALSRLSRPELAEEAVQETLLCAHRWLATYDSRYSFRTWLWTILLNQCSRQAKREAKHKTAASVDVVLSERAAVCLERTSPEASPLERLLAQENAELLGGLLSRLPEVQADALRLRFFGGLSFPEIAAAMQSSEAGAKLRVKSGLITLSKWLTEGLESKTVVNDDSPTAGAMRVRRLP